MCSVIMISSLAKRSHLSRMQCLRVLSRALLERFLADNDNFLSATVTVELGQWYGSVPVSVQEAADVALIAAHTHAHTRKKQSRKKKSNLVSILSTLMMKSCAPSRSILHSSSSAEDVLEVTYR